MNDVKDLVEKVKEGDTDPLKVLYETYLPTMKNACSHIVGTDQNVIDDIVQDAFILAYYNINQLKDGSKFGAWVTSITKNVTLKYVEKKRKSKTIPFSALKYGNVDYKDREATESALSEKEILRLVNSLPPGYAKIFKMNAIEGYSHKEIAEILGIAPHSSSSQLARAKALLRKMISKQTLAVVSAILVSAYFFKHLLRETATSPKMIAAEKSKTTSTAKSSSPATKNNEVKAATNNTRISVSNPDNASSYCGTPNDSSKQADTLYLATNEITGADTMQNTTIAAATTDSISADSVILNTSQPSINYFAEDNNRKKKRKWEFLAAGSIGSTMAQSVLKVFAGGIHDIGSDAPTPVIPPEITTWEDYYNYLLVNGKPGTIDNADALKDIALHNQGELVEREHHHKPITFELSITKSLSQKWKLETGVRYSFLKSNFTLGEGAFYISKTQKIHYLGIPVRALYRWMSIKKWSVYSSAGALLNIPIHGTVKEVDVTGNSISYQGKSHIVPPLQWSIESGIGLQYDFTPHWGIYVEPTIKWHIPNGSTIHTIWTEHPFTVTVPFGIRISW